MRRNPRKSSVINQQLPQQNKRGCERDEGNFMKYHESVAHSCKIFVYFHWLAGEGGGSRVTAREMPATATQLADHEMRGRNLRRAVNIVCICY